MKQLAHWASRQVFDYVHGHHLVYNTCWEDPRLDREVMQLGADDEVVVITSAGCNVLDYALDEPRKLHGVDLNFRQNALLELKLAGIRELPFDDFFALFGEGGHPAFPEWYRGRLRPSLGTGSRRYWDRHLHFLSRRRPEDSLYRHGTTGWFARGMLRYFRTAGVLEELRELFSARSLAEQREIYFGSLRHRMWNPWVRRLLETDAILSLLGVPRAQRDHLERTCSRRMADFMQDAVEAVLTRLPVADNYFWRVYLFGRYTRECCPSYLQRSSFERLQAGLADRIEIHTGDLTAFLRQHRGRPSRLVLLDHMDWLSHGRPAALAEEWQAIVDRARPGARVLWRSGGSRVDYVDPIRVRLGGREHRLGDLLSYRRDQAVECHARDRVHTYGSFHIADLAA